MPDLPSTDLTPTIDPDPPHSGQVDPGEWWACSQPERPADSDWTIFDLRCASCRISAHAALRSLPLHAGVDIRTEGDPDGHKAWIVTHGAFAIVEDNNA